MKQKKARVLNAVLISISDIFKKRPVTPIQVTPAVFLIKRLSSDTFEIYAQSADGKFTFRMPMKDYQLNVGNTMTLTGLFGQVYIVE